MARVDLTEPYAIANARRSVRESLQAHGEEVVAFGMYHSFLDEGKQPRCPVCYNDIYNTVERPDCPECFGTGFKGGIKVMSRMWAMVTETPQSEQTTRRGEWMEGDRQMQAEWDPHLWQNDFIMRIPQWSQDHRPLVFGEAFVLDVVTQSTLRTGNQFGQDRNDVIGQKVRIKPLPTEHPIYRVIDRGILRSDFPVQRTDGMPR